MSKFKHRAFVCCCIACRIQNATFHKLAKNAYICESCKISLEKNKVLEMNNGGKLAIVKDTCQVVYLPPQENKETNKIKEVIEDDKSNS